MSSLLRLARAVALSNLGDARYPYRLTYVVTYRCQLRCSSCKVWQRTADQELTLEQIDEFFSRSNRFSWVNLSGGELFLREDIEGIMEAVFRHCRQLYLLDFPTNGFATERITETVARIIRDYRPPRLLVTISLDGPQELHDRLRGVGGSWEKAIGTFARLCRLRNRQFGVFFGMTLQPENADKFLETFREAQRRIPGLDYSDFHLNLVHSSRHYYGNEQPLTAETKKILKQNFERIAGLRKLNRFSPVGLLERRYQRLVSKYLEEARTPVPCQALSASFFLDPRGDVYPCSIYDRRIGNIVDFGYDIDRLWKSSLRNSAREEIRQYRCPQCWTPCEAYQSILANIVPRAVRS